MAAARKTADERKGILAQQITNRVAMGMRVETQSDYQAVLVKGRPINHVLHLILTLVTVGFWGVVWVILFFMGGERREIINIDEWGNPQISRL